jgi:hypothetical protein
LPSSTVSESLERLDNLSDFAGLIDGWRKIAISLGDHSRRFLTPRPRPKSMAFRVLQISLKVPLRFSRNFSAARFISEFGDELAMAKFIREVAA